MRNIRLNHYGIFKRTTNPLTKTYVYLTENGRWNTYEYNYHVDSYNITSAKTYYILYPINFHILMRVLQK